MTKIKAAVNFYRNVESVMAMVHKFDEGAEALGHNSLVKEAARYAEELGLQLQLEYPNPTCIQHESGEVMPAGKLKVELRKCL